MNRFVTVKKTALALVALVFGGCFWLRAADLVNTNAPAEPAPALSTQTTQKSTNSEAVPPALAAGPGKTTPAAVDPVESTGTNSATAPEPGSLPNTAFLSATNALPTPSLLQDFQTQLDLGREQRRQKNLPLATQTLTALMTNGVPAEIQRLALFELALTAQDDGQFVKAEQIFAQYIHTYPEDPSVPEILLRQGLIYRQMGINSLAVSKFYAVMSSALKLKLDNMDYYKKLVLQAQMEIADTFYLEGRFDEAADFFSRLAKTAAPELDQPQIQFKLIRSLSFLTNHIETVAKAGVYLSLYTNSADVPEVRFLLASALKKLGRNQESMRQVLLLLQSQQENVRKNPETWSYWQERAGNEIANQLYKEGDFLSALQIYLSLSELNTSPAWQLPVWYQTGLVYEQLKQWQKAGEVYTRIQNRQKELTESNSNPSLVSLCDMAKWRKDYIDWMQNAQLTTQSLAPAAATNGAPAAPRATE